MVFDTGSYMLAVWSAPPTEAQEEDAEVPSPHPTPFTLHATHYTLHTTHYTLHTTHYTLHTKP